MIFSKDEPVLVRNKRGKRSWLPGKVIRQKGPVTYLVQVGTQIRFCHVDYLLKTGVKPTSVIEEKDEISDLPQYSESRGESDAVQDVGPPHHQ